MAGSGKSFFPSRGACPFERDVTWKLWIRGRKKKLPSVFVCLPHFFLRPPLWVAPYATTYIACGKTDPELCTETLDVVASALFEWHKLIQQNVTDVTWPWNSLINKRLTHGTHCLRSAAICCDMPGSAASFLSAPMLSNRTDHTGCEAPRLPATNCDLQRSFRQQVEFFRETLAKSAAWSWDTPYKLMYLNKKTC